MSWRQDGYVLLVIGVIAHVEWIPSLAMSGDSSKPTALMVLPHMALNLTRVGRTNLLTCASDFQGHFRGQPLWGYDM